MLVTFKLGDEDDVPASYSLVSYLQAKYPECFRDGELVGIDLDDFEFDDVEEERLVDSSYQQLQLALLNGNAILYNVSHTGERALVLGYEVTTTDNTPDFWIYTRREGIALVRQPDIRGPCFLVDDE